MHFDTQRFGTLMSTVTPVSSSHQATATLWQLLLCTRNILQHPPDCQEAPDIEQPHTDPQHTPWQLMVQCLQEQQPGYQRCSRRPKEWICRDALTAALPGLLQTSLCLLAAAHDSEHLSLHKPPSSTLWAGTLSEEAQNQQQELSAPSSEMHQQVAGHANFAQELNTNVRLLVMQLQGLWNLSSSAVQVQSTGRVLFTRPDESTQPSLVWKAVASGLLHMHATYLIASRLPRSIPRATGSTSRNKKRTAASEDVAVPGVMHLGAPMLVTIAHSAAQEVYCWLHDAHAMLCSRARTGSNGGACSLPQQLGLPPAGAFQVLHL
jgi:hypothetical protein